MYGKLRMFGKTVPAWILALVMIVGTAGAATGVVLAGRVTGEITATVSQALVITDGSVAGASRSLFTVKDDGTAFTASAEIFTGDMFDVNLHVANNSNQELTGELTLVAPEGVTLSVSEAPSTDMVPNIVRTGPFTWKFRLGPNPNPASPNMVITVAMRDDLPPGFYSIDGTLKQVNQ